jgi:hypothetical protein
MMDREHEEERLDEVEHHIEDARRKAEQLDHEFEGGNRHFYEDNDEVGEGSA